MLRCLSYLFWIFFVFMVSCKQEAKQTNTLKKGGVSKPITVYYAKGFTIEDFGSHKIIEVTTPWPESKEVFRYLILPKGTPVPKGHRAKAIVRTPITKLIVTSTTDIPMLESLGIEDKLIGFPNTAYISSEKTRKRIDQGQIKDIGKEVAINTEMVLDLAPDLVIGFSATGDVKAYEQLQKAGIPVVMNGSWMEQHPLGRTEWIKFIGAFFDKNKEAYRKFRNVESAYVKASQQVLNPDRKPTILSGSLYKDIWYVPGGNSFFATILQDAGTSYLWDTDNTSGSIALSFETVLDKAQDAEFWIGAGGAKNIEDLVALNTNHKIFNALQQKKVFSESLVKGVTGGILYYELGAMRPDLILKDVIRIVHPEILPEHKLFFFRQLP